MQERAKIYEIVFAKNTTDQCRIKLGLTFFMFALLYLSIFIRSQQPHIIKLEMRLG